MIKCTKCKLIKDVTNFGKRLNKYDTTCKDCRKEYYQKNRIRLLEYQKLYDSNNKINKAEYKRLKRNTDELFKIKDSISSLIRSSMKGLKNKSKSEEILGCSIIEFRRYIENQFKQNMTWLNHGDWELDHIKPIALAKTYEELIILNHYTNFQPLWKTDNRIKGAKYE